MYICVYTAYFMFDLLVLLRYDRDIGFICHHLAGLGLCAGLYASKMGAPGHQWLVFTAEFPTLILNMTVLFEDTMKYIKGICGSISDEQWNLLIKKNVYLRKLKKKYRFCLVLFAVLYGYFRCYEWSKRKPTILRNLWKDAEKIGIHPFSKWNWLICASLSYVISIVWSYFIVIKTYKFGIMGRNDIWD